MRDANARPAQTPARVMDIYAVVVGSGAAGFNAAHRLRQYGVTDAALVTEGRLWGTSRNTGSDKQTYYKLSLSGSQDDSVRKLAAVLFDGGCVDGDIALCEAALSAQGFFKLLDLGVPFPHSRFGEFVGYKTDHDPNDRGTSAGPYTSRYMTEALERAVRQAEIPVYDHLQVIRILTWKKRLLGILCLDRETGGYVVIRCRRLIWATGGPAGIYRDSVYPASQLGASGLAFEAGAAGRNLTEWQYGLASLRPRWNVSGSYMQVLPRLVSTDAEGGDEREFLLEHYLSREAMMDAVFLKGYQWPFDAAKAGSGSSVIDLLVYRETCVRGRRVWLDYRKNSEGMPVDFGRLSPETREYLERAGACQETPYRRLQALNQPAVDFYMEHGVDLSRDMLEVAVCAQHNNGGLAVDAWWRTDVEGLFAAGEAAGTHGITRPGGSALNAGQAGSSRAAEYIAAELELEKQGTTVPWRKRHAEAAESRGKEAGRRRPGEVCWSAEEEAAAGAQIRERLALGEVLQGLCKEAEPQEAEIRHQIPWHFSGQWKKASAQMSRCAAMVRDPEAMEQMSRAIGEELGRLREQAARKAAAGQEAAEGGEESEKNRAGELCRAYRYYDMRICQKVFLDAMLDYYKAGGRSRGSAVYREDTGEIAVPELVSFTLDGPGGRAHAGEIQEIRLDPETMTCSCSRRPVRPLSEIPEGEAFEAVWKQYRERTYVKEGVVVQTV